MISFEEYKDKESKIQQIGNQFFLYIHGEHEGTYGDILEAQDMQEDILMDELHEDHKYICDFCNLFCNEFDVQHRIEDASFTAPYGETFVLGKDVASVPVCPLCQDDLEETRCRFLSI